MNAISKLILTVEAIAKNTTAYGFKFVSETVKKDGKVYKNRPVIAITDHDLFWTTFPDIARERLAASVKIASQAYARNTLPDSEVHAANVSWLLGERVTTPARRYGTADGMMFATKEEMLKHAAELQAAEVERRMKQA